MYRPRAFDLSDTGVLQTAVDDYSFATFVMETEGELEAVHLPLLLDCTTGPLGTLRGHVARANPVWKTFAQNRTALCIFHGPHAYISPLWYRNEDQVPTWNYLAVHAYGCPRVLDDEATVRKLLDDLSAKYEDAPPNGWSPDRVSEKTYTQLLGGIVAFELTIDRLDGKLKMSQNRATEDQEGAISALDALGTPDAKQVADLMRGATTKA
ncbi:MAG: FMN-binding negative transcriptional regulator [Rhodospirillales bacterium]|nr:FMN-binding negative transcriptional regulator [Rhodospirillales bacterium]